MAFKRRSTLSPINAKKFKQIFDRAIVNRKNIRIKIKGSPSSYHTKISDALKFLIMYEDKEHTDSLGNKHEEGAYARLRGEIKFRQTINDPEYVMLSFLHLENQVNYEEMEAAKETPDNKEGKSGDWKEKLVEFIQNPQAMLESKDKPFEISKLALSVTEQQAAEELLKQIPNAVFDVSDERILVSVVQPQS